MSELTIEEAWTAVPNQTCVHRDAQHAEGCMRALILAAFEMGVSIGGPTGLMDYYHARRRLLVLGEKIEALGK